MVWTRSSSDCRKAPTDPLRRNSGLGSRPKFCERYHAETCTFHFSCGEYVVLPIDWTAILGIRFGGNPIPDECVDPDDAAPRRFFLYFIGSCFLGDNKSEIKLKLIAAVRVVSSIRDFDWGALTYGSFIYGMRCFARGESNSSLGFWQILSYRAYEYIPSLRPQYQSLLVDAFPRVMVPVDPPPSLTSSQAIPFDLAYKTGDLSSYVKNDLDYAAWFRRTFTRLITDECPGIDARLYSYATRSCSKTGIGSSFRLGTRSSSRMDVGLGSRMAPSSKVDNGSGFCMGPISSAKMGTKPFS
uniref:Aminotransferase-like plant mobile domain-containing protein n=1 Tax=Quercus lobata TaxID=97700 RepID=A0A7N2MAD1_QUELO